MIYEISPTNIKTENWRYHPQFNLNNDIVDFCRIFSNCETTLHVFVKTLVM